MEQKYLGITPYSEDGKFEFAGRSDETWALYERIIRNDYTVYYAASGEGKSSLIRAGLFPILRRRDYFPVYIVFDDTEFNDVSSFDDVINKRITIAIENQRKNNKHNNFDYEQSKWSKNRFDPFQSDVLKQNLWWKLRNYCFKQDDIELKPLLVFDQFEEVFTKANYDWTNHFFSWLEEISTDCVPNSIIQQINLWGIDIPTQKNFKALFSFRTEYLGDLDYWCVEKHFIPSLQENRMCLKPLTTKGAREVINLNESLVCFADSIIQGCFVDGVSVDNEYSPCVYALVLSVVCQTLSELSENERDTLLKDLNNKDIRDKTIDEILLKFYKRKLKSINLDYDKDEAIINRLEKEFVDDNGKRKRRNTNEESIKPILKYVQLLSQKDNGLLKIIGKKELNGVIIHTLEFPHDRLCKAIKSSFKEKQAKLEWKLKRQSEWIQFGIIAIVVGVIAFLWNAFMPALGPVIDGLLSEQEISTGIGNVGGLFWNNYLRGQHSELANSSLDEGFSTLSLMALLLLFIPLITICISRKTRKMEAVSLLLSFLGAFLFGVLWIRNSDINFTNNYVYIFTVVGFFACLLGLILSISKLRVLYAQSYEECTYNTLSIWPLFGGYFIFACYIFYECLFRTTFGINEPCDSSWSLLVMPVLYAMWSGGFFYMKMKNNHNLFLWLYLIVALILLGLLFIISYMPYSQFKQSYGLILSAIMIILLIVISVFIVQQTEGRTKYCVLTTTKRVTITILGIAVLLSVFFLNLGFNPFVIKYNSVGRVLSWRTVEIYEKDSLGDKRMGVVYSTNGEQIIPCCVSNQFDREEGVMPIEVYSSASPFIYDTIVNNADGSLIWEPKRKMIKGFIKTTPTLEEHLHKIRNKKPSNKSCYSDNVVYYAAQLFHEIREANINYLLTNQAYDLKVLKSLDIMDSLQKIALSNELDKFLSNDTTITDGGTKLIRPRLNVLEDKHLIDFNRELSRSILLCLIKDRANYSDMPAMFTLYTYYILAYFTDVPYMKIISTINISTQINLKTTNKNTIPDKTYKNTTKKIILSDDILNRRVFAWYDLFNSLCYMDMMWNRDNLYSGLNEYQELINQFTQELSNLLSYTSIKDILKDSNTNNSLEVFMDYLKNYQKIFDPEYYETVLEKLKRININPNALEVDKSLKQIKDSVLVVLLHIMKTQHDGVYNNEFENICKNLILVTAYRGDVNQNDITEFSDYLNEKNGFFDMVYRINTEINPLIKEAEKMLQDLINELKSKSK